MRDKYAASQIALHWLTVLLLIIVYATMELRGYVERGSWQRFVMTVTHFSAGATILVVMLSRLLLKIRHRSPAITPPYRAGKRAWHT